ncbi:hypothetical protein C4587_00670 [Candidatus Parcubacteria bacterium]|nr:MAG: hypothetical protein C4587_00670 [Candidatus Parcubacteria bacterium]
MATPTNQNLIRQVSAEEAARPPGFYKSFALDVLSVAAALAAGYGYREFIGGGAPLVIFLVALGVFFCLSVFEILLIKSSERRLFVLLLAVLALVLPFWENSLSYLLGAGLVLAFFFLFGEMISRRELANGLEFRFMKAFKPALSKYTTGVIIALLILYIPYWSPGRMFISESVFQGLFASMADGVRRFYPELILNSTFGDLAGSLAGLQLKGSSVFTELNPVVQDQVLKQTSQQIVASARKALNVEINEDDSASSVFYELALVTLNRLHERFGGWFLAGWAVVAFFIVRGFGTIFYWIVSVFSFLVYQFLLAINFVKLGAESRTHEVVEFN